MKVRRGFVSNSSSSSFVCVICDNVESGYDASLNDVGICECDNGHTMCQDHIPNYDEISTSDDFDVYAVKAEYCPICNMEKFEKDRLLDYAISLLGTSRGELEARARRQFSSYDLFKKGTK